MRLKWSGFNEKGSVIIELEPESLCLAKDTVFVHGDTFTPKDELHVTLIRTSYQLCSHYCYNFSECMIKG